MFSRSVYINSLMFMKRKGAACKITQSKRCGSWRIGLPHNTSRSGFHDLVEGNVEGQEIHKSQRTQWIKCIRPRDSQNSTFMFDDKDGGSAFARGMGLACVKNLLNYWKLAYGWVTLFIRWCSLKYIWTNCKSPFHSGNIQNVIIFRYFYFQLKTKQIWVCSSFNSKPSFSFINQNINHVYSTIFF